MENLLPIGRFAKMCRLSVKSLRHYDELGLLVPAAIDPVSGYRYYSYAQANRAEAIRVLRTLDMPLDDIREALGADDPQLAAKVLDRHRAHLEAELARHTRMLAFLRRLIEREEGVMPYQVELKELPAAHVASCHVRSTRASIGQDVSAGYVKLVTAAERASIPLAGPPYLVMESPIEFDGEEDEPADIELGFPVAMPYPGDGDVQGLEQPAMTVAYTVHRGPYDEIGPAYHTVQGWIQEHGHEVAGPPREVYLNSPQETTDPSELLTEVQFPITG